MAHVQDNDKPPGALELIVQNSQADLIMHPRIIDLVDKKWNRFARRIFFRRFLSTLIYLCIFLITTILDQTRTEVVKTIYIKEQSSDFFYLLIFNYRQKVKVKEW